jgi:hypothetical protein
MALVGIKPTMSSLLAAPDLLMGVVDFTSAAINSSTGDER